MNHYDNLSAQAEKLFRHNRKGSYKTKERYREAYKRFLRFTAEKFRLQKIANISGKHLNAYVDFLHEKGSSASTVKTDLSAIRFWHDQIPFAKYQLPENSEFELERRHFGGIDRSWSKEEVNRGIALCRNSGREDYAACIIIARGVGLRLHEIMRIDTAIARAAMKAGYIKIKGKGGKLREVPITENVKSELDKFVKLTPTGHKLFVPQGKQTHIAKTELQNFINRNRRNIQDKNSTRPLTFHGLRHTCARDWYVRLIKSGARESEARLQVSKWLGHEREDVTRIYLAGITE